MLTSPPADSSRPRSVTAILLSWQRVRNLPLIVEELWRWPRLGEVLVWNNNPEIRLDLQRATVINAPVNYYCLPRYCLVLLARHDTIWFQDDDLLVTAAQLEQVHAAYARDPSRIYGCRGRNLVDGRYTVETVFGDCDIILGQTMLFHRRLVRRFFAQLPALPPVTVEDDIVFSLACGCRHVALNVGPITDLGYDDEAALWRRPDHFTKRQRAVELMRALAAGGRATPESDEWVSREPPPR
ncbi:hypothetical protein [Nitrospira sp. Kam-Ns4a]